MASVFFIGYLPFFPGTWVSLLVVISIWFFQPSLLLFLILIFIFFVGGVKISSLAEKFWGHDSQKIVIDELLGMLVALVFLPQKLIFYTLSFFLFRFFDVLKPLGF